MLRQLQCFKKHVLIICLLLIISSAGCGSNTMVISQVTKTPVPLHSVKNSNLAFIEMWRHQLENRSNSWYTTTPPHLFVVKDKVIIGEHTQDNALSDSLFSAFSLEDGKRIWQTRISDPDHGTDFSSALLDEQQDRLYLLFPFLVRAFDLQTGTILWTSKNLMEHTSYAFYPQSTNPLLLNTDRKKQVGIDPSDGEILFKRDTNDELMTVQVGSMKLVNAGTGHLTAVDDRTGQYLWQKDMYRSALLYPLILENGHLLAEFGPALYSISCVDFQTGREIWSSERNIVSNIALIEKRVFAFQENGMLVAYDVDTGQYLGGIEFDRGITKLGEAPYWVAARSPYLLVYLGDSHELFAFKINEKNSP